MQTTLKRAFRKDKEILRNLYSLYLHDLSKYTDNIDVEQDGLFHFSGFSSFWEKEGLTPYLISNENSEVIGFLLLLERPLLNQQYDFCVNDLFILNKFRSQGYGTHVIKALFKQKQGKHYVIQLAKNEPAVSFWKAVLNNLRISSDERNERIGDDDCVVQSFEV